MSAETILTMANGKGVDLLAVRPEDIDFETLAEHIAKEKRFNGATRGREYSVAQHLCIGTDAMLRDGASEVEAAYFLLHDVQEGLWKDDPTPKKRAIAERIQAKCGVLADDIHDVLDGIVDEHDAAIHAAAGVAWPVTQEIARVVKYYDVVMFVTEWRDLMRGIEHPSWKAYEGVRPLETEIVPWRWNLAMSEWLKRAKVLLPTMRTGAAS
jgi:hypothetical protein